LRIRSDENFARMRSRRRYSTRKFLVLVKPTHFNLLKSLLILIHILQVCKIAIFLLRHDKGKRMDLPNKISYTIKK
jgi:hypothetical protein